MLKKIPTILLASGWLFFAILAWLSRERIMDKLGIPHGRSEHQAIVRARTKWFANDLAAHSWQSDRPPVLFLGDSHLELGNWYPRFRGRFPIRNMGISMSRIADATEIASQGDPSKASALVILSGSNDLTAGDSVDECLASFRKMFGTIKARFPERPVIVLSIPPSGRDLGGQSMASINSSISGLNRELAGEAARQGFTFIDVTPALTKDGALNPALTFDGQHLNEAGYGALAGPLFRALDTACPSLR